MKPGLSIWGLFLGLIAGFSGACGYHWVGGITDVPPDIRSVAIPIFINRTLEEGIESQMTRALVEKFTSAQRIPVLSEEGAETVLLGSVKAFVTTPITVTLQAQTVTEYRATMVIEFVLKRKSDGKVLRSEEIQEWRNYPVAANLAVTDLNKREAIQKITVLLAERIHEAVLTNF